MIRFFLSSMEAHSFEVYGVLINLEKVINQKTIPLECDSQSCHELGECPAEIVLPDNLLNFDII